MKNALTARLAVSAVSILLACGAVAQRNQDKIHQSYAFWDFEYSGGTLDIRPVLATDSTPREVQTLNYRSRKATFSWDFARAIPFYWTIGTRVLEYQSDASLSAGSFSEDLSGQQERSAFSALGLRIRASNAADFYLEFGTRYYDTDDSESEYLDALRGDNAEDRDYAEAGIRARIGPSQRWELQASLFEEQFYGARVRVGLQYNAGDSFAFSLMYELGGKPVESEGILRQISGGVLEVARSEQALASLKFYY